MNRNTVQIPVTNRKTFPCDTQLFHEDCAQYHRPFYQRNNKYNHRKMVTENLHCPTLLIKVNRYRYYLDKINKLIVLTETYEKSV